MQEEDDGVLKRMEMQVVCECEWPSAQSKQYSGIGRLSILAQTARTRAQKLIQ
jgi:hypothetical protein